MTVHKFASRWSTDGNKESSILDLFRKYQIVFSGKSGDKIEKNVKVDDFICISDGLKIVAVAKVRELPKKITDYKFDEIDKERFYYDESVTAIKVHIVDLKKSDFIIYKKIGAYHKMNRFQDEIIKFYENENKQFSIDAKTYTIFGNGENSFLGNKIKYTIPIYQRAYSWTKDNIQKFVQEIFTSYCNPQGELIKEATFFGNMQFTVKKFLDLEGYEMTQEVIDGQQRLSTILVLIKTLQLRSDTNIDRIKKLKIDWLQTSVNNKSQQIYLQEFMDCSDIENLRENSNNIYYRNAFYINTYIDNFLNENITCEDFILDADDFIFDHFFKNLFFVVIETQAGLSKTLQIFDRINTTGLDLNGTDVFKIRMFEYLKDIKNNSDDVFEEINKLYERIDNLNKNEPITNMSEILGIYQIYLIAKNNMSRELYDYNSYRFFECLFDTLLGINKHNYFTSTDIDLNLQEINKIIDSREKLNQLLHDKQKIKTRCEYKLLRNSRYGKYTRWTIIYLYIYGDTNFEKFVSTLSKVACIYSIKYQKVVNDMHNRFRDLMSDMVQKIDFTELLTSFTKDILDETQRESFTNHLKKGIAHNWKWKYLICRTSALLEDEHNEKIYEHLFETGIDIEHIESTLHKDASKREEIHAEWGELINSIGNLVILESEYNRSIGNKSYSEKLNNGYCKSEFKIMKKQLETMDWNKENAEKRRSSEVDKLVNYYLS